MTMSERTNRATEVVDTHTAYWESSRPGTVKSMIEDNLLDVAADPGDVRYGHGEYLYAEGGGTFQGWVKYNVGNAMAFTATQEFFHEILLTMEMLVEEDIDWLPLRPRHLPNDRGFMLFPYGIEVPKECYISAMKPAMINTPRGKIGDKSFVDIGGGDRWMVDGFMWWTSDRVSKDGVAGISIDGVGTVGSTPPCDGVTIMPLTRWRGRNDDRPFRLYTAVIEKELAHSRPPVSPGVYASDITAWAFDDPGQVEWIDMKFMSQPGGSTMRGRMIEGIDEEALEQEHRETTEAFRLWLRSLVWCTWRWMQDEIWITEMPDRAARRRAAKKPKPVIHENMPEDGSIVIVDLRAERKEEVVRSDETGEPPWWRCRWKVRGHWARRRYAIRDEDGKPVGPTKGPDAIQDVTFYYKKVKIEQFEKGPANMPLVYKEVVGVINR
jgi:hypothetical protein